MSRLDEISKNLQSFEIEKAERMKSFWYRLRLKIYQRFKIVI